MSFLATSPTFFFHSLSTFRYLISNQPFYTVFLNGYFLPITASSFYNGLNFQRLYSIHSRDLPDSSSCIDDNIT